MRAVKTSRRFFCFGSAALALTGCGEPASRNSLDTIDARVDKAFDFMFANVPDTRKLNNDAVAVLMMPLLTEASFLIGGTYGRGALRINNISVAYYSAAQASFGLELGLQQHAHALFFMTDQALAGFRQSPGLGIGANAQYVVANDGQSYTIDTSIARAPVVAVFFGAAGLELGFSLEGTKYTRIDV